MEVGSQDGEDGVGSYGATAGRRERGCLYEVLT